jgi:GNAT superfamily N-acetyltransferase
MHITIRPATIEDLNVTVDLYIEGWQTAYVDFIPDSVLHSFDREKEMEGSRGFFTSEDPHFFDVAVYNGAVIGYVAGGPFGGETVKFDGEVYEIFIRKEYQNKGVGKMLLHHAGLWFESQGYTSVGIWCWRDNPNRVFYERLGGRVADTVAQMVGGKELGVDIFSWELEDFLHQTRWQDC